MPEKTALTCFDQGFAIFGNEDDCQHSRHAAQENGGKKGKIRIMHRQRTFILKEKIKCQENQHGKHRQQPVLNHARIQKGRNSAAFDGARAYPVDTSVDHLVVVFIAEQGDAFIDQTYHEQPVQMVEVPAFGKQSGKSGGMRSTKPIRLAPGLPNSSQARASAGRGQPQGQVARPGEGFVSRMLAPAACRPSRKSLKGFSRKVTQQDRNGCQNNQRPRHEPVFPGPPLWEASGDGCARPPGAVSPVLGNSRMKITRKE